MDLAQEIVADKAAGTRRLVAEYGNRLYETAIRLCGNEADAQDYAFRTLERAVERIRLFSGRSSFFTWLYEILVNLIRTDARRKAANALVFPGEYPPCEDPRPNVGEQLRICAPQPYSATTRISPFQRSRAYFPSLKGR